MYRCPQCESSSTRKSRKQSSRKMPRAWYQAAYRCDDCGKRFVETDSSRFLIWAAATLFFVLVLSGTVLLVNSDSGGDSSSYLSPSMASADATRARRSGDYAAYAITESLRAAAEEGDRDSQYQLGMALREESAASGDFAVRDAAFEWLEAAASNGQPQAQAAVGALYLSGQGVLQDFSEAARWFRKAARQGEADAMFELGKMTQSGWGMDDDPVEAYVWLNVASARGDSRAAKARDQVMKMLSAQQLKDAQQRARELDQAIPRPELAENSVRSPPSP
jgi:TPR repeat protein